ncbi:hypothetical protein F751_4238 [Auxenochlorella protothecoides]|uniref:GYF domain-containing protein n=2 Tax=Auxenochlorella protothecoides TaxID=3075 RepID=A0A087SA40_AUXPR|nr:hypothetical protein F751_4238 [Auxenochlorella protothecoides]KFM22594.1 hypothetical protein F751_4238 [Auxenochlorella protothecoides]RMZ57640.1 hypothetical protein APUTEX25_001840 [Auxenochlorella protothecoides]|eukprot:RMZ57640.1 hypothetical protein APUTEX25_001840 [Auxenochlorella protothecoides]
MFGWGAPPPAANEVAQLAAKSSLKSKKKGDKKVGKKPAGDNPLVRKIRPTGRPLPPPHEPFQPGKYEHEDRMMVDYVRFMTAENVWYYRDRMSVPRGPCSLPVLREAWVHGVVDENTLVWGQGLADWLPIRNVRTLVPQIRTVEVQLGTWFKKNFALRPALDRMRRARVDARSPAKSTQVENMY